MNSYGMSKIGLVRKQNEDRFYIDNNLSIVADGMGGNSGGEIASSYVIDEVKKFLKNKKHIDDTVLKEALNAAHDAIKERSWQDMALRGMGTTGIIAYVQNDTLYWASVGDSRIYVMHDNVLTQITKDHSLIQELYDAGSITKEEMATHPMRHMVTKAIGMQGTLNPDGGHMTVVAGDRVILCSDGLTEYVDTQMMSDVLQQEAQNDVAVQALIEKVYALGARDNVTVVVGTV